MQNFLQKSLFSNYELPTRFWDEVFTSDGVERNHYKQLLELYSEFNLPDFEELNEYVKDTFFNQGVTFNVYSDKAKGVERIFPFDLLPRIITSNEWEKIEKGVIQRNLAINLFLNDIYHDKKILKDKIVPAELVFSCSLYCKQMIGLKPVGGIYTHIAGTDLIKHSDGEYYVLEDNVRCPSGVSYVISNRDTMKRTFSSMFSNHNVAPVQDYTAHLREVMQSVGPIGVDNPTCVVLTPGMYNSAYYEHSFLALSMGIPLVEGRDLFVEKNHLYMKTIYGPKRVDVVYRRVDDEFIDPLVFRSDSQLGVPGLMGVYRDGKVTIMNAPGTGASDDKAIYCYVPDMIRYYLGEEPILNNVHTYRCEIDADFKYVIENMEKLVIKPVDESGGYGILIGPASTKAEQDEYKHKIALNRRKYIAQPVMDLSVHATYIDSVKNFEPRHIDLRTYSLMGKDCNHVLKGGLTRVALRKNSLVVNSSQGGGSKDTWVLGK